MYFPAFIWLPLLFLKTPFWDRKNSSTFLNQMFTHNSSYGEDAYEKETAIVSVSYENLLNQSPKAMEAVNAAFCQEAGFGALEVTGVPRWRDIRKKLFETGAAFTFDQTEAMKEARLSCESENRVAPGWKGTPGFEKHSLQSGFYCNLKASNDEKDNDKIWHENKWPSDNSSIKLKSHVNEAGRIMYEVVLMTLELAQKALLQSISKIGKEDSFSEKCLPDLRKLAEESTFLPSRLVYYDAKFSRYDEIERGDKEYWLPWHVDFNLVTALAPACWLEEEVALQDGTIHFDTSTEKGEGLLLRSSSGKVVPAALNDNSVLVQLGAHCHLLSGGLLRAGPHAVSKDKSKMGMGRFSFGIFVYGPWDTKMETPQELLCLLNDRHDKEIEKSKKIMFSNDYGGLLEKAYTGETVLDGFKKFQTYMNTK